MAKNTVESVSFILLKATPSKSLKQTTRLLTTCSNSCTKTHVISWHLSTRASGSSTTQRSVPTVSLTSICKGNSRITRVQRSWKSYHNMKKHGNFIMEWSRYFRRLCRLCRRDRVSLTRRSGMRHRRGCRRLRSCCRRLGRVRWHWVSFWSTSRSHLTFTWRKSRCGLSNLILLID